MCGVGSFAPSTTITGVGSSSTSDRPVAPALPTRHARQRLGPRPPLARAHVRLADHVVTHRVGDEAHHDWRALPADVADQAGAVDSSDFAPHSAHVSPSPSSLGCHRVPPHTHTSSLSPPGSSSHGTTA